MYSTGVQKGCSCRCTQGGGESEDHDRPDYGTEAQTYIIDGSGVYVTRNTDTYRWGQITWNTLYLNRELVFTLT